MSDHVVLVDSDDRPRGVSTKTLAHQAPGLLHRAISIVLWTPDNKVVLQRRSHTKYHFAGLWSNSCCSHPRPDESVVDAGARRVTEELRVVASALAVVDRFAYSARDDHSGMVEREVDHVLVGCASADIGPDPAEIADIEVVDLQRLADWFAAEPRTFSPWFFDVMSRAVRHRGSVGMP